MLQLTKVISNAVEKSKRIVKFLRYGLKDTQTAIQVAPYGVDSNPIKDMIAVYAPTSAKGDTVIIGYINKSHLAAIGEHRIFSTNADGELQTYIWLHNDGTMEIGGTEKNLARFQELESGFNELKTDLNNFITKWNAFATAYVPGSPSLLGTPPTAQTADPSSASIAAAKIDEIKTL